MAYNLSLYLSNQGDSYPFNAPDSKENIILDVDVSAMIEGAQPVIKAATLEKLVQKLTLAQHCGT